VHAQCPGPRRFPPCGPPASSAGRRISCTACTNSLRDPRSRGHRQRAAAPQLLEPAEAGREFTSLSGVVDSTTCRGKSQQ
jgi:hypothetical protein